MDLSFWAGTVRRRARGDMDSRDVLILALIVLCLTAIVLLAALRAARLI